MRLKTFLAIPVVLMIGLSACGGGSKGGGTPAPPPVEAPFGLGPRAAPALGFPDAPVQTGDVQFPRAYPGLGFSAPLAIASAPGDTTHLYVAQQGGQVRAFDSSDENVTTSSVFLDLTDRTRANGEQGLLGLAFDPDYASNGYVYVYYSANANPNLAVGDSVIARYTANRTTRVADRASELRLLQFTQPFSNHNGGGIAFGPDGMLYIASGDGGSGNDPMNNAQNLGNLLGKILRIAPDGSVPADNPFVGTGGVRGEIWAYGLRNPFRFSFDRANGRLWAGDVGQNAFEEIDLITRGGNYGWRVFEGNRCNTSVANTCASNPDPPPDFIPPVLQYSRDLGVSVTGGIVYRGSLLPGLIGRYLYADFGTSRVWALTESSGVVIGNVELTPDPSPVGNPSSFGEDLYGEPLITSYAGRLVRMTPTDDSGPDTFPQTLSDTGLFTELATLTPAAGVIPYAPNAPFWSDGTRKRRWIAVPGGQGILFSRDGNWVFPQGTVTVKHFEVTLADQSVKRLETRVFVNQTAGWQGYTYRWNEAGTEADLLAGGANVSFDSAANGTQNYEFPDRTQCLQCHTAASGFVLGLRTAQLNGAFTYPNNVRDNQLRALDNADYFTGDIGSASSYAALPDPFGTAPLATRARAYLESNCAQCHQPGGPTPVDMDLRAATAIGASNMLSVMASGEAVGGATVRIAAGDRLASLIWTRMNASDEADRMPPIATHLIDQDGVNLIGAWIDAGAN